MADIPDPSHETTEAAQIKSRTGEKKRSNVKKTTETGNELNTDAFRWETKRPHFGDMTGMRGLLYPVSTTFIARLALLPRINWVSVSWVDLFVT